MRVPVLRSLFGRASRNAENGARTWDGETPRLLRHDAMDEHFRRVCAVFSDGRCVIVKGYSLDPQLRETLKRLQRDGAVPRELAEVQGSLEEVAEFWSQAVAGDLPVDDSVVSKRARELLEAAARVRASDIVFEMGGGACVVSVIVNDRRCPLGERLTEAEGSQITGFLFHSKEEGTGQTSYQRASFQGFSARAGGKVPMPGRVSGLRCERGPHEPEGDHLVARIFYRDQLKPGTTVESLGFTAEDAEMFAELRRSLSGGVILGGSTGDGKSTTLAVNLSLQQEEHGGQLNMVTVEDPVEYEIPGAIQIAVPTTGVGEDRAKHFARALMHFVRIHPAVGMVSEVRDAEAAREVLQFIATGHQVWTTIHVADANGILFRMLDMGVEAAEVCRPDLIKLLMKQTLISLLCDRCCLPEPVEELPAFLARRLQGMPDLRFRNPEGCEACAREGAIAAAAWNGYRGQTAVAETIKPDAGYLAEVRRRDAAAARAYWVEQMGGIPIGWKIWAEVVAGRCDPLDAIEKGASVDDIEHWMKGVIREEAA